MQNAGFRIEGNKWRGNHNDSKRLPLICLKLLINQQGLRGLQNH